MCPNVSHFTGDKNDLVCSPSSERLSGILGKYNYNLFKEPIGLFELLRLRRGESHRKANAVRPQQSSED